MNRTDRLVAMVMHLQGRRVVRAEELANHFEVTMRTIYRDVAALGEAGVPVVGEAGVGYSLMKGYHLPPVMFSAEEAMALFLGAELVKQFADASVAAPMDTAVAKIRSVLPQERQDELDRLARSTAVLAHPGPSSGIDQQVLLPIQRAVVARRVLRMNYRAGGGGVATRRDVEPLGVVYYSSAWYLVAWCRLRKDFRHFKLRRLGGLEVLHERFPARANFSLREHLEKQRDGALKTVAARVRFSADAIERVRRDRFVGYVGDRAVDDGYAAEFLTFSLEWFARWLLSFGRDAEVLAPAELRGLLRAEALAVAKRHDHPLQKVS